MQIKTHASHPSSAPGKLAQDGSALPKNQIQGPYLICAIAPSGGTRNASSYRPSSLFSPFLSFVFSIAIVVLGMSTPAHAAVGDMVHLFGKYNRVYTTYLDNVLGDGAAYSRTLPGLNQPHDLISATSWAFRGLTGKVIGTDYNTPRLETKMQYPNQMYVVPGRMYFVDKTVYIKKTLIASGGFVVRVGTLSDVGRGLAMYRGKGYATAQTEFCVSSFNPVTGVVAAFLGGSPCTTDSGDAIDAMKFLSSDGLQLHVDCGSKSLLIAEQAMTDKGCGKVKMRSFVTGVKTLLAGVLYTTATMEQHLPGHAGQHRVPRLLLGHPGLDMEGNAVKELTKNVFNTTALSTIRIDGLRIMDIRSSSASLNISASRPASIFWVVVSSKNWQGKMQLPKDPINNKAIRAQAARTAGTLVGNAAYGTIEAAIVDAGIYDFFRAYKREMKHNDDGFPLWPRVRLRQ